MYHDGKAASTMLTPPTPRGSITPVTMVKAFYPIEKMPPVSPEAQSTQVSHTQALNLLQDTQVTEESTVRKPTLVKIVKQPMDQSDSSAVQTQRQPVTPVSFVSTTQVRMDMVVPPTVSQVIPQVPPVWVPLLQITSVASIANMAASLISQQSGTSATTHPQQQTNVQCKKCGKKNHSTTCCHKKVTCKQCKGKDHSSKFCTMPNQQELKCTFCRKNKHSTENCKARKKAEKKLKKELRAKKTPMVTSTATSIMSSGAPPLSQAQPSQSPQQAPVIQDTMPQVPLQTAGIEERLQCLANGVNLSTVSGLLPPSPAPPTYTSVQSEDGQQAHSTVGSAHSIPTLAPGMYRHNNNQRSHASNRAPSTVSSLESHKTEISKTMLQLAQAHEKIASTQQQNHQTMVNVQQQQATAFEALATAT